MTCSNCGKRLELVYPKPSYYTLSLLTAVMAEVSVIPILLLIVTQRWFWVSALIAAGIVANYLATRFLNSRATVRIDDLDEVSRKEIFGRRIPK